MDVLDFQFYDQNTSEEWEKYLPKVIALALCNRLRGEVEKKEADFCERGKTKNCGILPSIHR